ncbi:hypothetical protein K493DRAFT_337829 [Basidiobolus meristosporus CBS 931.73]|uniref:Plasmid pRiA4b Orf3-like domain-containing protein n=1 Tax=Basidiobolus meristosporus CBS 931.73 TaxID=1314790 RepID=A0A1Y1Y8R5_9FUNG|nr:hypothetical protein K493DRAFT_337829 [Basidiobolus meristosporus CBS 931.73]|eukprot:ORX94387.1 hypothetical protein K493DRAFT_337829 [Basidiobolus meristosporus CBS 931.73]
MTNLNEKLYVIRASLPQQPHVWRTVLIPETYSLLQLHIVLQDLFGWRDSEYSFHIYHQTIPYVPKSDMDGFPEIEALLSSYFPSVVYQLVLPNECDGWIKHVAPGMYIEHTHPHDPTPLLSVHQQNHSTEELLAMRILKDERVYKLKNAFEQNPKLRYEFDPGVHSLPTFQLDLQVIEAVTPSQEIICLETFAPIVIDGEGSCTTGGYKFEAFNLSSVQKRLNHTHFPQRIEGVPQCYVCRWYQHDCLLNKSNPDSVLYETDESSCYCLDHECHKALEPLSEEQSNIAWEHCRDELLIERAQFLSTIARNRIDLNCGGLQNCHWREYNNEPCVYCSSMHYNS